MSLISQKLELASDEANVPGSTVRDNGLFYRGYRQRLGMRVSAENDIDLPLQLMRIRKEIDICAV